MGVETAGVSEQNRDISAPNGGPGVDNREYDDYFAALLAGERETCVGIVERMVAQSVDVNTIYTSVIQRSMYAIGDLWERNQISVAVEHLATSISESVMATVYPVIFGAEHTGKRAIVSCVANEYHQIGGKMVADFFELHGWDGYFLGANTRGDTLLEAIEERQPDLVALSLSLSVNVGSLYAVLEQIGRRYPMVPVIVSGQAFRWIDTAVERRYPHARYIGSLAALGRLVQEGVGDIANEPATIAGGTGAES